MTAAQDRRGLRSRWHSWATEVPLSWSVERAACGDMQLTRAGRGPARGSRRTPGGGGLAALSSVQLGHGGAPQLVGRSSELPAEAGSSHGLAEGRPAVRAGRRVAAAGLRSALHSWATEVPLS